MSFFEKTVGILCAVLLCSAALAFAAMFVDISSEWYQTLQKPVLWPSSLVFAVVCALLYVFCAISLSFIILRNKPANKTYMLFFTVGVLNALLTYTFFLQNNATAVVFILLSIIAAALALFINVYFLSRPAAYLLVPYIIFACFAIYLGYEIAFLN